ncbi:pilus assembly protein FimV [Comamonas sp. BIGb0152]|uniref:FimV/HubP family polar landmark protein n=1 Tax=Comamonas sp. BIGb0152 TaxID=2940601 RepID=UPI00216A5FC2|nr:FimV/HubP family polar landmark protein [Comamonas sp. BIGb0152]MCS4295309.1 pilus assembly protein FimV [Comamonas sp. BIGb0152]
MHRWKITALAAAMAAFGLYTGEAAALALGKINVKSALGEPLRAEIEVPQINDAEADTLQVKTASSAVFRTQGMDYSGTASSVRAQLQRRANGTAVIVLTTQRPVNDPFVDYVIDANWNSGQVVRSYTMLFDPPNLRKAEAAVTIAPQISAAASPAARPPAPPVRVIEEPLASATPAPAPAARSAAAAPRPAPRANVPASASNNAGGDTVRTQRGDTLGRIAAQNKPADISLDQMLVAVVQSNPHAFVGGNVNRMKAGVNLTMPSAEQARAVSPRQARQMVAAQSRDFNSYRSQLAAKAAPAQVATDTRAASGKVEASVDDKKPQSVAPDQLKLSKEAAKGSKSAEASVASAQQANAAQERTSELNKNIEELNKLKQAAAGSAAAAASSTSPADSKPAATATVPASGNTPAPAAAAPAATPAPAAAPATPAVTAATPAPVAAPAAAAASSGDAAAPVAAPAVAPKPVPKPAPAPVEEPSFVDDLLANPLLPAAGGLAILALLGGLWYRSKKRKEGVDAATDSVLESSLAQDSFFGASGGQHIDTSVSAMTTGNSSLAYTPSQLDAGDVDPVAEADVYLAYGRDLQAEEILKEALRTSPTRSALHAKLAEIYAKRKDRLALESIAKDARQLTGGTGPDWLRIAALGQELDAANPIYQNNTATVPSAEIVTPAALAAAAAAARAEPIPFENTLPPTTMAAADPASAFSPSTGLDFAMSSQLTETPDAAARYQAPAPAAPVAAPPAPVADAGLAFEALAPAAAKPSMSMEDFDRQLAEALSIPSELSPGPAPEAAQSLETQPGSLDFQLSDFDNQSTAQMPIGDKRAPTMDFDMTSLALDLPGSGEPDHTHPVTLADDMAGLEIDDSDPLATKLTLAQEFLAIGDKEGARSLAEEVMAESSSATVKAQAQRLLDQSR